MSARQAGKHSPQFIEDEIGQNCLDRPVMLSRHDLSGNAGRIGYARKQHIGIEPWNVPEQIAKISDLAGASFRVTRKHGGGRMDALIHLDFAIQWCQSTACRRR